MADNNGILQTAFDSIVGDIQCAKEDFVNYGPQGAADFLRIARERIENLEERIKEAS